MYAKMPNPPIYCIKIPELVPEATLNNARVEHFEVTPEASAFSSIRAMQHGSDSLVEAGHYARLMVGSTLWMSDTDMERRTNSAFCRKAKGDVLIAGLGLGLIIFAIADKPEVRTVTVIEQNPDVVDLVTRHVKAVMGDRLTVITADIYKWKPEKGKKYDTIYFDIWADQSTDCLQDMARLHRRFAHCKAPGAWMGSWRQGELKARKMEETRRRGQGWRW